MKSSTSRNTSAGHGFTLLELLIAMTLLTLIVAITMGALRLASRSVAAGDRKTESQERLRTVMTVMDAQIQSQLPLTYQAAVGKMNYFRGDAKTLRMTTSYSIWGGRQGYIIVDYRVAADSAGKQTLYAAEQTPGIGGSRETRLFTEASEISFEYFAKEPTAETGQWSGMWSDEVAFPEAVKLHVWYGRRELVLQFPVRARGNAVTVLMTPPSAPGGLKK